MVRTREYGRKRIVQVKPFSRFKALCIYSIHTQYV
jgi:hypothetical protein